MTPERERRIVEVAEYGRRIVEQVSLSERDLRLIETSGLDSRLGLRPLVRDRLEIRADCHVGVVTLDSLEIRVVPKLVGGSLAVLQMVEYASDSAALRHFDLPKTFATGGPHLRDLIALMLARECERLLRMGPRHDYRTRVAILPAVRGRLLADRQLLSHYGRLDRLECRYDERSTDVIDNQLCAVALHAAARTTTEPAVRAHVRRLAADFGRLCVPRGLDLRSVAAGLHYGRHNAHYRSAHRWALLLLDGGGIRDLFTAGDADDRVFLLDMNTLFEAFVTRLAIRALRPLGIDVRGQSRHGGILVHEDTGATHTEIRPDLLLTDGHGPSAWRRPVDIKYKLYADRKLSSGDLYQSFLYAWALGARPGTDEVAECHVVYASEGDAPARTVAVRAAGGRPGARITAHALAVPVALDRLAAGQDPKVLSRVASMLATRDRRRETF
ncbi:hypothetical protein ABZV61_32885 [Streptomyces sp900116325]|uniref:5-methylcytosine-specific restriction enzyme subunit McrC n=1 Tax=Streptomyces sp. 900116325 TaxID=3154295 RepID=A0ABV2UHY6_9ACTN